jgi:hypothetical protein
MEPGPAVGVGIAEPEAAARGGLEGDDILEELAAGHAHGHDTGGLEPVSNLIRGHNPNCSDIIPETAAGRPD